MSTVLPEQGTVPATPVTHPTPCPVWCKDGRYPAGHNHGLRDTAHRSFELKLAAPGTSTASSVLVRAELFRLDENAGIGDACLWIAGQTEFALTPSEFDVFLVQAQAFVDSLRVLRAQMG
jgi:hypothetical protein